MYKAIVDYQVGSYGGRIEVYFSSDTILDDDILVMAKRKLRKNLGGSLPFGCQYFSIIRKEKV